MEIKFQILCLKNELIQIPCYNCSIEQGIDPPTVEPKAKAIELGN